MEKTFLDSKANDMFSKFNNSAGSRTSIKTHYTYNRDTSKKELSITNRYGGYNISGNTKLQYGIYADGIRFIRSEYNKIGVLNSKLVKEGKVTTDNNKFSFSSITPKISKDKTGEKKLINGVIVPMTITGFDETSFKKEDDKFYTLSKVGSLLCGILAVFMAAVFLMGIV